jgi:uncharacterized protein (DUF1810 family)
MSTDRLFDLERFVRAQQNVFEGALKELRDGRKVGHWMWFIFPQMRGLGKTEMSLQYGISSLEEAEAYLSHRILGKRLRLCTQTVNDTDNKSALQIFGEIDSLKFRSCMTLFAKADDDPGVFQAALSKYYKGVLDVRTLQLIG